MVKAGGGTSNLRVSTLMLSELMVMPLPKQIHKQTGTRARGCISRFRLMEGIDLSHFRQHYDLDIMGKFGSELDRFFEAGLIERSDEYMLFLTKSGLALSNEVFSVFV